MRKKNILLVSMVLVLAFQGCATNSLLKLQEADLAQNGVVTGNLRTGGLGTNAYFSPVYLTNVKTEERFNLTWRFGSGTFFSEVPAGKYSLFLGNMISKVYNSQSTVPLNLESLPFWVEAGEVAYIGDATVSFYKTNGPDLSKGSTWLGFMVGHSESKGKLRYEVQDNFTQSESAIKAVRPEGGYRHTKKLISFGNSEAAQAKQVVKNDELFIDTGVAESVDVSKFRYEVKGKAREFKRETNKLVWYALPSQETRDSLAGKDLEVELIAPDKSVIQKKTAHVANDLGLMLAEFDLSGVEVARNLQGQWFAQAQVGDGSPSRVLFEFKN